MPAEQSTSGPISVPVAIVLGLFSSFIQSLGLTIQRKSHLQNALLPQGKQRSEWRRPLWLIGFAIFIVANIGGTVFQIGALPIVMLAPLGAVSLLYNALLARFILDDFFSRYMVLGTALIAAGAVLIGYFGVVQEPNHSLDDLLALYARPPFIAFASVFALAFMGILAVAHLAEWQLHIRLFRPKYPPKKNKSQSKRRKPSRRWSAPSLAPLVEVSESSSGIATPVLAIADEAARRGIPVDRVLSKRSGSTTLPRKGLSNTGQKTYGSIDSRLDLHTSDPASSSSESLLEATTTAETRQSTSVAAAAAAMNDPAIRRTCLGLAVAYGGASGTLSGACLLFAKSGVELLVLTIEGDNQFDRWQSWFLVATMLAVALLQLWYLNKSLRLADPTLVCPLAFCFYNTSSIMLGLVYFDQLGSLSALHLALVVVGIAVLLAGVWTVSMHGSTSEGDQIKEEEQRLLTNTDGLLDSPLSGEPASILSPVEAGNPTEMDALLANVGGIGGPHLPPMSSSAIIGSPQSLQQSELPTSPTSPTSPKSPKSSSISSSRGQHSRARTRSGSFIAGLGMRVPGLPVQSVRFEEDGNDNNVNVEAGGAGYNVNKNWRGTTSPDGAKSREGSPQTMRSKRHFYETLLERGLSIGISPSSPGFHLRHSFEEDLIEALQGATDGSSSSNMPRRNPRRTFSEADVDAVMAERDAVVEVQQEEAIQEQEQASSAWTRVIPAVDYHALSDRLSRLGQDTSGWFGGFFRTRNPESTA